MLEKEDVLKNVPCAFGSCNKNFGKGWLNIKSFESINQKMQSHYIHMISELRHSSRPLTSLSNDGLVIMNIVYLFKCVSLRQKII